MSDQTVTSKKLKSGTGPDRNQSKIWNFRSDRNRAGKNSDRTRATKFQILGWIGLGDSLAVRGSLIKITDLLLNQFRDVLLFHPSIFDYVIIWKSCGWKIFKNSKIFQLQRFSVVWPMLVTCFFIACFLGMNDDNIIIVTLQNFYRSSRRSDELWRQEKSSKKWKNHRGSRYKRNFCRNLHDQKKIIVMKNFLSMFSCMYVNSQWLTTLNRGF